MNKFNVNCSSSNRLTRDHFLKEPHHTVSEQKIYLFFIFEAKNVCLLFTSVSDFGLWCKMYEEKVILFALHGEVLLKNDL